MKWGTPTNKKSGCKAAFFVYVNHARERSVQKILFVRREAIRASAVFVDDVLIFLQCFEFIDINVDYIICLAPYLHV